MTLKNISIGKKIVISMLATTLVAMLLTVVIIEKRNATTLALVTEQGIEQGRRFIFNTIDEQKDAALSIARQYANDQQILHAFKAKNRAILDELIAPLYRTLNQNIGVTVFEFGDARGLVFTRGHNPGTYGDDKSSNSAIQATLQGQEVSGFAFGKSGLAIRGFVPVKDKGAVIGTFQTGFNLNQEMLSRLSLLVGPIAFYEKDTLTQTTSTEESQFIGKAKEPEIFARLAAGEAMVVVQEGMRHSTYLPMPNPFGTAIQGMFRLDQDVSFVRERQRENLTALVITVALAAVGVLLVAIFLGRGISRPVNKLMRYADAVAKGDLQATSGIDQDDEIGRLAKSISSMVENLEDKSYWYESMLDAIPFPVSVTDTEMRWTFINKAAMEVTGKRREDALGKQCRDWGADICGTDRCGIECLKRGQSTSRFTHPGLERDFQVDAAYLTDRTGTRTGHIEVVQDVTEANRLKRQAEQALKDGMLQAAASIEGVVERMTSASEELAAQVEQSSRGAEEQKNRAGETATAMEEMNATVLEVAKNASNAAEGSDKARAKAQEGARVVDESVAAINQVESQAQSLKEDLGKLGQQAEQIGKIMNVIEDIADQTNLLALNAAIEAARAGDAGRGFAVVADEVRKLAEKTMNATKEVGDAIAAIQEGTRSNIQGMEQAVVVVGEATKLANTSGEALQEIVTLVEGATDQVRSIATAAEEQSSASEEINRSVEDINRISSETSEVMDQSAQAISELARQAVELRELVEQLKRS